MSDLITAVDYLQSQKELEQEARSLMPYDPTECTYEKGELRQPVYACLSCSRLQSDSEFCPIGVCYSCSIQCHADHELVELFAKRNFTCDCGTTRMSQIPLAGCRLRHKQQRSRRSSSHSSTSVAPMLRTGVASDRRNSIFESGSKNLPADDIPGLGNSYNQNFKGLFCSCSEPYNPLSENRVMIQCHFGFACGEDWYHDNCILGIKNQPKPKTTLENKLDSLEPPSEDAQADAKLKKETADNSVEDQKLPFPDLDDFDLFICWKCVDVFPGVFDELTEHSDIVFQSLPCIQSANIDEWNRLRAPDSSEGPQIKKIKTEKHYSVFLKNGFEAPLKGLRASLETSDPDGRLVNFLKNYEYLYMDDPVYEPPEEEEDDRSSLLDLGTEALLSLPREQAIEGLQVYDKIRSRLRDFFKPFAEEGKVVTEDKVREFFDQMKKSDEQ